MHIEKYVDGVTLRQTEDRVYRLKIAFAVLSHPRFQIRPLDGEADKVEAVGNVLTEKLLVQIVTKGIADQLIVDIHPVEDPFPSLTVGKMQPVRGYPVHCESPLTVKMKERF